MSGYGGIFRSPSQPGPNANTSANPNTSYGSDNAKRGYAKKALLIPTVVSGTDQAYEPMRLDFAELDPDARINSITIINYHLSYCVRLFIASDTTGVLDSGVGGGHVVGSHNSYACGGADAIIGPPNQYNQQANQGKGCAVIPIPEAVFCTVDFARIAGDVPVGSPSGYAYIYWTTKYMSKPSGNATFSA